MFGFECVKVTCLEGNWIQVFGVQGQGLSGMSLTRVFVVLFW